MSSRDAESVQVAMTALDLARRGDFAGVLAMFASGPQRRLTVEAIDAAWQTHVNRHGAVWSMEPSEVHSHAGMVEVTVVLRTPSTAVQAVVSMDKRGRLLNLQVTPMAAPWAPPSYAAADSFGEYEVVLGDRPLAVGGTVSVPRASAPVPGVVLLSGGGPFNRDMTMGENRIGTDLAWGLASRGIAVLRFDKPSHTHRQLVAKNPDFTPTAEFVPYAAAAVDQLKADPAIDPSRIVIVGHSMGGTYAPRVAVARPEIAGIALLAAEAAPMHRAAVRVMAYLAGLSSASPAMKEAAAGMVGLAANVDSPQLSRRTDPATLPFGYSGAYWLDVRDYDPIETARQAGKPMLIQQGARDYQVTVDDDLSRWRSAFEGRPDVTIRVYDADDHLFFSGTGPSTPAGYEARQHVDEKVIADLADWIGSLGATS